MNQANKILNDLQNEANYLFDEGKINAKRYETKTDQILRLKQCIRKLEQENLTLTAHINEQNQEKKQTNLEFENQYLKACAILMGGIIENPFYKPLSESEKQFKQEVINLLYKAQKPLRWIDVQHAAHLQMFVNTFEQGINECKAILIEKYGPQKAAQLWEESGKRIQAA